MVDSQANKYLKQFFFLNIYIYISRHVKLEITSASPASNECKVEKNNSGEQGF